MQETKRPTLSVAPGLIGAIIWTQAGTLTALGVIDAARSGAWGLAFLGAIFWWIFLAFAYRAWRRVRTVQDRAIIEGLGQILASAARMGDVSDGLNRYFSDLKDHNP